MRFSIRTGYGADGDSREESAKTKGRAMRSFSTALFIFGLGLSPSLAQAPCSATQTPAQMRVSHMTPGYEPVVVLVEVPVVEGDDVNADAKKAFVTFSIGAIDPNVRGDVDFNLDNILQCTFTPRPGVRNEKMYLKVRMDVVWGWNKKESYTLRSGLILPKALVQKRPHVETELKDGTILKGNWETVTYPMTVVKKKKTVIVQRTLAQIALRAR
jgi:hypothetical protein